MQIQQYDNGDIYYVPMVPEKYYTRISSVEELADTISKLVSSQLKVQTGQHESKFKFELCDIIEVEKYLKNFPDSLNKYKTQIPRYFFVFNWIDTANGIKKYGLKVIEDIQEKLNCKGMSFRKILVIPKCFCSGSQSINRC